ncbi:hypothetical protein CLOM_g15495 [Closterium sp. NIES-68]|nr:hypothetical protein CLOM_g15495 [Closterium sp. NIES-68]
MSASLAVAALLLSSPSFAASSPIRSPRTTSRRLRLPRFPHSVRPDDCHQHGRPQLRGKGAATRADGSAGITPHTQPTAAATATAVAGASGDGDGGTRERELSGVRGREVAERRAGRLQVKAREAVARVATGRRAAAVALSLAAQLQMDARPEGRGVGGTHDAAAVDAAAVDAAAVDAAAVDAAAVDAAAVDAAAVDAAGHKLARDCDEQMRGAGASLGKAEAMMARGGRDALHVARIHLATAATLARDCAEGFHLVAPGSSSHARVRALQEAAGEARRAVMEAQQRAAEVAAMGAAAGGASIGAATSDPAIIAATGEPLTIAAAGDAVVSASGAPLFVPPPGASTVISARGGRPMAAAARDLPITVAGGAPVIAPMVTVAQDGSGDFRTVQEAIDAYPSHLEGRYAVFIRPGVYREKVRVGERCENVTLVGLNASSTIISFDDNGAAGTTTFDTATVAVDASGFAAVGIRFENTAGPEGEQAVALRQTGDNAAFYKCHFIGWQDTLYVHSGRQYYRNCYVNGSVDFIFGNGAAVLDRCVLHMRAHANAPLTASKRESEDEPTGIVILNSRVKGDLANQTFLGRPWGKYARVAVINTTITDVLNTDGWLDWNGDVYDTTTYIEYNNSGPGAAGPRIEWARPGIVSDPSLVAMYYPETFLAPFATIMDLIPLDWV